MVRVVLISVALLAAAAGVRALPIDPRQGLEGRAWGQGHLKGSEKGGASGEGLGAADQGIHLSEELGLKTFRTFTDESGRERVFHGVNAVVKGPPWLPSNGKFDANVSLGADDFAFLQQHGVNVIRLGLMWAGAEPKRGEFDETYLKQAKDMAAEAATYGIYTLLDMHQDVMSDKFCGEGVPAWAAVPTGYLAFPEPIGLAFSEVDPRNGFPTKTDCMKHSWPSYYLTEAVCTAFQNLYDNKDGLLDAWGGFWAKVAETFMGDKHVLGFELINEPWAGDAIHNPGLLVPGVADHKNLQPAYDVLSKAIRAVDPSRLIFFEGVTWGRTGFTEVPGGSEFANRSVLAYHHYEIPAGPKKPNTSASDLDDRLADGKRLRCGLFLTEFAEAMGAAGGGIWDALTGEADRRAQSWTNWEYKTFCRDDGGASQWDSWGSCRTGWGGALFTKDPSAFVTTRRSLARTYAMAVSGDIVTSYFESQTSVFYLVFVPSRSILTPTEIYTSDELHYKDGASVRVDPPDAASWLRRANGVSLMLLPAADTYKTVKITISPAAPASR